MLVGKAKILGAVVAEDGSRKVVLEVHVYLRIQGGIPEQVGP